MYTLQYVVSALARNEVNCFQFSFVLLIAKFETRVMPWYWLPTSSIEAASIFIFICSLTFVAGVRWLVSSILRPFGERADACCPLPVLIPSVRTRVVSWIQSLFPTKQAARAWNLNVFPPKIKILRLRTVPYYFVMLWHSRIPDKDEFS